MAICRHSGNFWRLLATIFLPKTASLKGFDVDILGFGNFFNVVATNLAIFAKMLATFWSEHLVTLYIIQLYWKALVNLLKLRLTNVLVLLQKIFGT